MAGEALICMSLPDKIPIRWMPDLHTAHVGRFHDSKQFFLAEHLVPLVVDDSRSREYVALYCFDSAGMFARCKIVQPRRFEVDETVKALLAELGPHRFMDICVSPFEVTFDNLKFGLIPDPKRGAITLQPGSVISFMQPWDGEYYT
jgi:hypothetical protein